MNRFQLSAIQSLASMKMLRSVSAGPDENCLTLWGKDSFLLSSQKNRASTPNTVARKTLNEMKKAKIIPPVSHLDADDLPYDHRSDDLENHGDHHHGSADRFHPKRFQILRIQ